MANQITSQAAKTQEISLSNRAQAIAALIEARKDQHITLLEASWVSGVSWDAVRAWSKGRREPTMGNLVAVAQTLGFEIILRPQGGARPVHVEQLPVKKPKRTQKKPNPNQLNFFDTL